MFDLYGPPLHMCSKDRAALIHNHLFFVVLLFIKWNVFNIVNIFTDTLTHNYCVRLWAEEDAFLYIRGTDPVSGMDRVVTLASPNLLVESGITAVINNPATVRSHQLCR